MNEHTVLTTTSRDPATIASLANWQTVPETFLNTLSSPVSGQECGPVCIGAQRHEVREVQRQR